MSTPKTSKKKKGTPKPEKKHIQHGIAEGVVLNLKGRVETPLEEQLFPHELAALKEFKEKNELTKEFEDYYLVAVLMSRKFDIERAGEMLENTLKYKKENNIKEIPYSDEVDQRLFEARHFWAIPGTRSKQGCGVMYILPARMVPKDFAEDEYHAIMKFQYFMSLRGSFAEGTIDTQRNGVIIVEDLKGMTMKNFDMKLQKKMKTMTDTFPMRIKQILILNPPTILKALMAIAKLFMKKKIFKRVRILKNQSELLEYIEKDQLHVDFGGTVDYTADEWIQFAKSYDEIHKKQQKAKRTPKKKKKRAKKVASEPQNKPEQASN